MTHGQTHPWHLEASTAVPIQGATNTGPKICISLEAPWPSSMVEPGPPKPWRLRRLQRGVFGQTGELAGENAGVVDIVVGSPTQIVIYQHKSGDDLGKWLNSCPIEWNSTKRPRRTSYSHWFSTTSPQFLGPFPQFSFGPTPPTHNGTFRNLQPRSPR